MILFICHFDIFGLHNIYLISVNQSTKCYMIGLFINLQVFAWIFNSMWLKISYMILMWSCLILNCWQLGLNMFYFITHWKGIERGKLQQYSFQHTIHIHAHSDNLPLEKRSKEKSKITHSIIYSQSSFLAAHVPHSLLSVFILSCACTMFGYVKAIVKLILLGKWLIWS